MNATGCSLSAGRNMRGTDGAPFLFAFTQMETTHLRVHKYYCLFNASPLDKVTDTAFILTGPAHIHRHYTNYRVRTVMENLEKSWHSKMDISRPGKVMEKNSNHKSFGKVMEMLLYSHVHLRRVCNN